MTDLMFWTAMLLLACTAVGLLWFTYDLSVNPPVTEERIHDILDHFKLDIILMVDEKIACQHSESSEDFKRCLFLALSDPVIVGRITQIAVAGARDEWRRPPTCYCRPRQIDPACRIHRELNEATTKKKSKSTSKAKGGD